MLVLIDNFTILCYNIPMNHLRGTEEEYFDFEVAEKMLAERLENVTESIEPSPGYEVQLEGVQTPNPLVWGALEMYFDTILDVENGASITLGYDPASGRLVLKELGLETKGQSGPVFLRRTTAGYIPIQTIDTAEVVYSNDSMEVAGQMNSAIQPRFGDNILESFGIADIPMNESQQYQLWLAGVLGNTRAWRLTESTEIPLALTDSAAQSVVFKKTTVVGQEAEDFFITRSLTERIVQKSPVGDSKIINESIVEMSGDIEQSPLSLYLHESIVAPDLVVPGEVIIESEKKSLVAIHEAEYSRLKKKLEEVALLKHQLSQLD